MEAEVGVEAGVGVEGYVGVEVEVVMVGVQLFSIM